jgi:hypothetical protein
MTEERILAWRGSKAPVERALKHGSSRRAGASSMTPRSRANVIAERDEVRLIGEVKGYRGSNTGLEIDTMFGQLLSRIAPGAAKMWVIVGPTPSLKAVLRVASRSARRWESASLRLPTLTRWLTIST